MAWALASIFYAYQYILRVMPNIMIDDIMAQFDIGAAAFGQFSGVYYIGYSLMHLPLGIMLDRLGPKKVVSGCIFLTVLGMMPLVFAQHWAYSILGRLLLGIGSSGAILGVFKVIRMMFKEEHFARMLSVSVTVGLIGAIYGGAPVDYMKNAYGHRFVIEIFALYGLALAALSYYFLPEERTSDKEEASSGIREVLSNKKVIFSCIFAGLMVGPLEGFADVWGTVFFKQVYGFDAVLAASLPSTIFVGMCFGSPILTFIAEKTGSYIKPVIYAALIMALSFSVLLWGALSPSFIGASFLLVGICCAYQILAICKIATYVPSQYAGLTTALANMIIMLFGYAFHGAIGAVVNAFGGVESSQALVYGISVIPFALSLGAAGFGYLALSKEPALAKK